MWILVCGGIIASTGASFVWPLTTIYVHYELGKPLVMAGLVLMIQAGASLLGQLAGGRLFDRIGGKPIMLGGLLAAGTLLAVIGLNRLWAVYVGAIGLLGFSYGLLEPATNALVAQAWPGGGRKGFNLLYVARNAGVAIGTALGGLVASYSFTAVFLCNAATALAYMAIVARFVPRAKGASGTPSAVIVEAELPAEDGRQSPPPARISGAGLALALAASGAALNWLAYSQWQAVISVYMRGLGYSLAAYSLLWTINGLVIVAGQPLVSLAVRRWLKGLRVQLVGGSLLYAAAFVVVWRWPIYGGFTLGMVILTLGEMLVLPSLPAAAASLANAEVLGLYQGLLGGAASIGRMFGPICGGRLYVLWSPPWVLAAAAAINAAAAGCYWLYGHKARC